MWEGVQVGGLSSTLQYQTGVGVLAAQGLMAPGFAVLLAASLLEPDLCCSWVVAGAVLGAWGGISGVPVDLSSSGCVGWGQRREGGQALTPKWSILPFAAHTCHLQNTHSFLIQHPVLWVPTVYPFSPD